MMQNSSANEPRCSVGGNICTLAITVQEIHAESIGAAVSSQYGTGIPAKMESINRTGDSCMRAEHSRRAFCSSAEMLTMC